MLPMRVVSVGAFAQEQQKNLSDPTVGSDIRLKSDAGSSYYDDLDFSLPSTEKMAAC